MFATNSIARTIVAATGAAIVASTFLFAAVAPAAASEVQVRSRAVSYADLDLAKPAGRATLDARIRAAARSVCSLNATNVVERRAETRCAKAAVSAATRS
jgi:UrcA family protein